jgi:hypothetical protein
MSRSKAKLATHWLTAPKMYADVQKNVPGALETKVYALPSSMYGVWRAALNLQHQMEKIDARKQRSRESCCQKAEIISGYQSVIFAFMLYLLLVLCGCQEKSMVVPPAPPFAPGQLTSGFYAPEKEGWRWVARSFAVALTPPLGVSSRGARLTVRLFLPETEIQTIGPLTLSASVDGWSLGSETYAKGGSAEFIRDLPFEVADTNVLPVQFCFDKAISPAVDGRELAAVVSAITFLPRKDQ